mmetsp:Transcript_80125/g.230002  ORF Transcript_80125/g.230002 Transcript_80125/m.230002 type:complete len:210 (+) Transcript_80125:590-1219(+)
MPSERCQCLEARASLLLLTLWPAPPAAPRAAPRHYARSSQVRCRCRPRRRTCRCPRRSRRRRRPRGKTWWAWRWCRQARGRWVQARWAPPLRRCHRPHLRRPRTCRCPRRCPPRPQWLQRTRQVSPKIHQCRWWQRLYRGLARQHQVLMTRTRSCRRLLWAPPSIRRCRLRLQRSRPHRRTCRCPPRCPRRRSRWACWTTIRCQCRCSH